MHAALEELAQVDPRLVRVVEMRHFGGMGNIEIAQARTLRTHRAARLGQGTAAARARATRLSGSPALGESACEREARAGRVLAGEVGQCGAGHFGRCGSLTGFRERLSAV